MPAIGFVVLLVESAAFLRRRVDGYRALEEIGLIVRIVFNCGGESEPRRELSSNISMFGRQ